MMCTAANHHKWVIKMFWLHFQAPLRTSISVIQCMNDMNGSDTASVTVVLCLNQCKPPFSPSSD